MTDPAAVRFGPFPPDQIIVEIGHLDVFDLTVLEAVVDRRSQVQVEGVLSDDDDAMPTTTGGPPSPAELASRKDSSITAKGLIDPTQFGHSYSRDKYGPLQFAPVHWVVPGSEWILRGPFGAYDDPPSDGPQRIPVLVKFMPHDHDDVGRFRWWARHDGWSERHTERLSGWVEMRDSLWHEAPSSAFPYASNVQAPACGTELGGPMGDVLLPLILGQGLLNADALGTVVLVLPRQQYQALRDQIVGASGTQTGRWGGGIAFRDAKRPALVWETSFLQVRTDQATTLERMRTDWELGVVFREAREQWVPMLPSIKNWRDSQIHTALRGMLPGLAAQGRAEGWTDSERTETMCAVLNIVLECRIAPYLTDKEEAKCVLGTGWIDPWSYYLLGGPSCEGLAELVQRYERIPGMWSPPVSRALAHALLLAETSQYMELTGSLVGLERNEFFSWAVGPGLRLGAPGLAQLRDKSDQKWRKEQGAPLRAVANWVALITCAALFGVWVGSHRGPIVGVVAGVLVVFLLWLTNAAGFSARPAHNSADHTAATLSWKMQLAVLGLAYPVVSWDVARRRMDIASEAGAVWAPEAWRLVEQARRREVASRTG